MKVIVSIALFICLTMLVFAQETITVTASKDNTLYSESGSTSNGSGLFLFSGKTNSGSIRRALIKFELPNTIPNNATITSVKLKLNVSKTPSGFVADIFSLHKIMADWGEGTSNGIGSGAPATTNDATWSHRFFNSQTWNTLGGDFSSTISASTSIPDEGPIEWVSTPQLVADVQGWLSNSSTNFGWIIKCAESTNKTSKQFNSRSDTIAANRPQLIIQYTTSSSVKQVSSVPNLFSLEQNYPNPFNPTTTIQFSVPRSGDVRLTLFDGLGKENTTLINQSMGTGTYTYELNASSMPSGIYYYRLQSAGAVIVKKLLLIK